MTTGSLKVGLGGPLENFLSLRILSRFTGRPVSRTLRLTALLWTFCSACQS